MLDLAFEPNERYRQGLPDCGPAGAWPSPSKARSVGRGSAARLCSPVRRTASRCPCRPARTTCLTSLEGTGTCDNMSCACACTGTCDRGLRGAVCEAWGPLGLSTKLVLACCGWERGVGDRTLTGGWTTQLGDAGGGAHLQTRGARVAGAMAPLMVLPVGALAPRRSAVHECIVVHAGVGRERLE